MALVSICLDNLTAAELQSRCENISYHCSVEKKGVKFIKELSISKQYRKQFHTPSKVYYDNLQT